MKEWLNLYQERQAKLPRRMVQEPHIPQVVPNLNQLERRVQQLQKKYVIYERR